MEERKMLKAAVISAMYLTSAVAFAQDPYANAPAYVKPVAGGGVKVIQPLVTTGQQVPLAGSTSQKYCSSVSRTGWVYTAQIRAAKLGNSS